MPKYYDRDTKVAYVQQIEEGKLKASQAARDLGVAEQTIYNWIKELRTDSKAGLSGSGHQKPDSFVIWIEEVGIAAMNISNF